MFKYGSFQLASERALDTMSLCGVRGRVSTGKLEPVRTFHASNGDNIRLQRPVVGGEVCELTQDDLDVLRAIVTKYVIEELRFAFTPSMPDHILQRAAQLDTITIEQAVELAIDELATAVTISPKDIRQILGKDRDSLPTEKIATSMARLSSLKVTGNYRVRLNKASQPVQINGNLLEFFATGDKREYMVLFATKWGQLFIHNVKCGNLGWMKEQTYADLTSGPKNILWTVISYPNKQFCRRGIDTMLELFNVKVGKDRNRAIKKYVMYLGMLGDLGFIKWNGEPTKITCNIDVKGNILTKRWSRQQDTTTDVVAQSSDEEETQEQQSLETDYPFRNEPMGNPTGNECSPKASTSRPSVESPYEAILSKVEESIQLLMDRLYTVGETLRTDFDLRASIIRRNLDDFSPYYLWTQPLVREYLANTGEQYPEIRRAFEHISQNPTLEKEIHELVRCVEGNFQMPLNSPVLDTPE